MPEKCSCANTTGGHACACKKGYTGDVKLCNDVYPYWYISGRFLRPFTGKLIHQKIMSTYSVFKPGRELDRFIEKLIQSSIGEF